MILLESKNCFYLDGCFSRELKVDIILTAAYSVQRTISLQKSFYPFCSYFSLHFSLINKKKEFFECTKCLNVQKNLFFNNHPCNLLASFKTRRGVLCNNRELKEIREFWYSSASELSRLSSSYFLLI